MKAKIRAKKSLRLRYRASGRNRTRKRLLRLRERSRLFNQLRNPNDRAVQILHAVFRLEPEDFVWQLYEQILHREPSRMELKHFRDQLNQGTPRMNIAASLMKSDEGQQVISHAPSPDFVRLPTVANMIQSFMHVKNRHFVDAVYNQLLSRFPDPAGISSNMQLLAEGMPRGAIVTGILASEECRKLMAAPNPPMQLGNPSGNTAAPVGILLGFPDKEPWKKEHIARFTVKLAEGLLLRSPNAILYVTAADSHFEEVEGLFANMEATYPGRLTMVRMLTMEWVNQNIPVEKWIVPYAGIPQVLNITKPFIICLDDMVHRHFQSEYYSVDPDYWNRLDNMMYSAAHKAAAVVFHSEFIRNHEGLQFLGLPPGKTKVIPLEAPPKACGSSGIMDEATFRHKYHLFSPYMIYPSDILPHKNHDRLIEAFLLFRQSSFGKQTKLQLLLTDDLHNIVSHTEQKIKAIKTLINGCQDPDAAKSIRFIGKIPKGDLPSFYKYALGTIMPTLFENSCPLQIMESLYMNTPVAVSRLDVIREAIPAMSAFITFDPNSVPETVTAIHDLVIYNHSLLQAEKMAVSEALKRNGSHVAEEYEDLLKSY